MNIPLILFLVLCWPEEVNSRVSYSLKLISFSNPDGTSWDQLRYHGNRRLCDSRSTDECDTYFKICIQIYRRGKCFINLDSKVYPNSNNITFGNDATWTGTTNNWDSNLLALINPFDKDTGNKPGDLIDILSIPLSVWPGLKQECTGHQPIVMTNHTTLIMEFKAWCSPGYSGPGCTFRYTGSDPYGSCNNGSMNLQCANEEPAIVRYSSYTPSSSTSIQSFEQHIGAFLKNHICDTLRLDSKQSLWSHSRVGFIAKCGDKPVDPIVVQAALGTGGYQNQGSLKIVPTPLNNYRQGMNVVAIFAVKIQSYTNQDRTCKTKGTRKCCDGGNLPHCDTDTCDTHFRICLNNDLHNTGSGSCITTRVRPDTNELFTCGDVRVNQTTNQLDVASTYFSVTDFWTWNNTYIHVEVRDADDGNKYDTVDVMTLKQDLTPGHWNLSGATAESVQLHGHVSLRLRLLVSCAAHKYGKNCDVQCTPSGHRSCDPDTGAAICQSGYAGSDCHDIDECKEQFCHGPGTHRCNNLAGSYQCDCNGGWTGKNCSQDVDECDHNPCHHGGTCNNTVGSYTCLCQQGYTGKNCDRDIDECQHNPCQHGGSCHNTDGSYNCTCHGFNGKNCTHDIDECQTKHPCQHGGTCNNTVGSYTCSCHGFTGKNCETDINECQHNPCQNGGKCQNTPGSYTCRCHGFGGKTCAESTTSNYSSSTSAMAYSYKSYVDAISLQCSEDAWKVHIHVPELYKRHVDFDPSDIYLGEPGCEGYRSGDFLVIYQEYSNCLTHHSMTSGSDVYTNTLVYALRDANYKFIIREFRFRIDLECNMAKQVTVSQHFIETNNQVRRRSNNPRISGHGYYNVLMAFYRDPNFLHQMTGHSVMDTSPLPVDIGTDIYVKLATHVTNTDVKMRLDVCYTLPSPGAGDSLKFYLIRNACVTDVNTRVLSILPHETKFVFRDFEYSTDLHNLYLYCTVTFCNRTDNSSLCDQQCHQRSPRSVIYPANGRYLHRISTSRVIPRPNVKGQRTSIPDEPGQSESHKHTDGIIFISSVLLVAVSVTSAILMMIQLRQKHERHDDDTNDI